MAQQAQAMVSHNGFVDRVDGDRVTVRIMALSACAGCHGEENCCSNEKLEKLIDAIATEPLKLGDPVIVEMAKKLGTIAILWMFVLPTIILFAVLISIDLTTGKEILASAAGLASVFVYYGIISFFRKFISKDFIFKARLNRNQQG